ncbi:MAG TPA: S8 family serine peptidase [Acidimicrobiales bacterium]|nr:S8 family serine peptidase [Acidimicrobiales bacterium]
MTKHRTFYASALVVAALAASTFVASSAPASPAAPATPRQPSGATQEYVVAFADGADAATAAVEAAGGTVVDVNEDIGVALVETRAADFAGDVNASGGVVGVARNHSVGTSRPGMPHRYVEERPSAAERSSRHSRGQTRHERGGRGGSDEPLADLQWNMDQIGADAAHQKATGKGVDVGIIDTGIDASHPDIAPNFDSRRSRNFTMDIPAADGPCEVPTCIDPANVDDGGHGTHVAGIVGADDNRFGVGGVAPDVNLVNLRAGQDSGFFFLYETVAALTEAGNLGLDVVNMSFYTDPWLWNCASRDDYISGDVTDAEIAEQALTRQLVFAATEYAHDKGVTLIAAAGNSHFDLSAAERPDATSPDFPIDENGDPTNARERVVTNNCLDLPSEAPHVISVSATGPSTTKADFSNYGSPETEVAAPGGWFRDFVGTPNFSVSANEVLSSYPLHVAIAEGLADENGVPTDDLSVQYCNRRGTCGFYTYLQGTSMASPHAVGVAALIVDEFGRSGRNGKSLNPDTVRNILLRTATDHACPAGGVEIYTDEGRPAEFNAPCSGTTANNGLYGEGIVNAARAVRR